MEYMKTILQKIKNKLIFKYNRFRNQMQRYDFQDVQNGWRKIGDAPVLGDWSTGTLYDPWTICHNKELFMFVSERKTGNIVLFKSKNGQEWKKKATIICPHMISLNILLVDRPCVIYKNNEWLMWFCAQMDDKSNIWFAKSNDGQHFDIIGHSPVLASMYEYEGVSVMNPSVIWDQEENIFKMWYAAGDTYEPDVLCYATSTDGIEWVKYTKCPVLKPYPLNRYEQYKVGGCCVLKKNKVYIMYYIGYQNLDVARICQAYSFNGIDWLRKENNLILGPSPKNWEADSVYKPSVCELPNGEILLWYNGRKGKKEYIGLAKKQRFCLNIVSENTNGYETSLS